MTLKKIIEKCSILSVHDKRIISDEYNELVFYNKEIDKWNKIFADVLGPAIKPKVLIEVLGPAAKPAGVEPTEDDLQLTKDYGGIYNNQTLFRKEFDDVTVIVMLWPWEDDIHTTLKMVLFKK